SLAADLPPPTIPPLPLPDNIPMSTAPQELRTNVIPRDEFPPIIASTPPPPPPFRPSTATATPLPPRPTVPKAPPPASRKIPALEALKAQAASLAAKDWGKFLKAEINSRWFLAVSAGVFLFWLVALSPLFIYSLVVARPKEPVDATLEKETKEK